ncbi:SDR family oxidoreductase [Micromonospora sp. URMC 103]|uniref:SDR family oxidoreductase n=1 Tax=Micromonospora sp. URMC 103 TaxID=3423406 RepID=UPI003F19389A
MASSVLVTGGTGTLGRLVVPLLRDTGHDVRVLSRHRPDVGVDGVEYRAGDLSTGQGVEPAVAGTDIVVHLAGGPKGDDEATRVVARAASRAGVRHLVYISVVGADRVPVGWLRTKLAAERAVADSGVPWTTLRAAQFHDLVLTVAGKLAKLPVVPVPRGLRFEPVDARDVADRLVELTLGRPSGLVPELAGPRVYEMGELLGGYLRARGVRRPTVPVPLPGRAGRAYRTGANLARGGATVGKRSWEDFLAERVSAR